MHLIVHQRVKVSVSLHYRMYHGMYSLQLLVSLCPTEDTEKKIRPRIEFSHSGRIHIVFESLAQIIITERHFHSAVRTEQAIIAP